jgi:Tol biopolymer transport system component
VEDDAPFPTEIADAVLDGRPVDWKALESALSPSHLALLEQLRTVAAISSFAAQSPQSQDRGEAAETDRPSWAHLRIHERIGQGAFGTVYRAWDAQLDREVALKLLPLEMPLEEARLLARLRHPNVVTIYGADRSDGFAGLWMESVRGETLEQLVIREHPLPVPRVVEIGKQLCAALAAVHRAGLVHRDVKAHNVMVEADGRVVLMDFGAVRPLADPIRADVAGTPLYLAPEIFAGAEATVQSDLYSVAVLLYYLLTRRYPTQGRTLKDIQAAHAHDDVERDVRSARRDVPAGLARAIEHGLARSPAARFETAEAMGTALVVPPQRSWGGALAWSAVAAAITIVAVAIGTGEGRRLLTAVPNRPSLSPPVAAGMADTQSTRRLNLPDAMLYGSGLSYDGRFFAFAARDGSVSVFNMASGKASALPHADAQGRAGFSIMSADGDLIAYQWWTASRCDLHIVGRDGQSDRTLLEDDGLGEVTPIEWSRDGSQILLTVAAENRTLRLVLMDAGTGIQRTVQEFGDGNPLGISLSKDGRYIAYDRLTPGRPSHRDLYVVATGGGGAHRVLPLRDSNDRFPLWTPDGQHLFFISDRSGSPDGWLVPVAGGNATGEPSLIVRNLGRTSSLGITGGGGFYYRLQTGSFDVYEVPLEPSTMAPAGQPRVIPSHFSGGNISPAYSPDGRHLAYISVRDGGGTPQAEKVLVLRDLQQQAEREVAPLLRLGLATPKWSPDGRSLLVRGTDHATNQWGVFVVDAATGDVPFRVPWPAQHETDYGGAGWTTDGTAIVFEQAKRGIIRHPLDGGAETVILGYDELPGIQRIRRFEADHGGTRAAFSAHRENNFTSIVVDAKSDRREVVRAAPPESLSFQGWSADDRYLVFTRFHTGPGQPHELWRVPAVGGAPERVGLTIHAATALNPVALSPSGTALAYTGGMPSSQLWMMDHFLQK